MPNPNTKSQDHDLVRALDTLYLAVDLIANLDALFLSIRENPEGPCYRLAVIGQCLCDEQAREIDRLHEDIKESAKQKGILIDD